MIPKKCTFCKGTLKEGKTDFIANYKGEVLIIRDVPAWVCEECGEAWFTPEISRKIDRVMEDVKKGTACLRPVGAVEVELSV